MTFALTSDRGPKGDENGSDQNGVELSQSVLQLKACKCKWKPISVDKGMLFVTETRVLLESNNFQHLQICINLMMGAVWSCQLLDRGDGISLVKWSYFWQPCNWRSHAIIVARIKIQVSGMSESWYYEIGMLWYYLICLILPVGKIGLSGKIRKSWSDIVPSNEVAVWFEYSIFPKTILS